MAVIAVTNSDRIEPLLIQEGSLKGATHSVSLKASDLATVTAAGDSATFTVSLPVDPSAAAPTSIEGLEWHLETPFTRRGPTDADVVTVTTVTVGNPDDADQYFAATKVVEGDTPVSRKAAIAGNVLTFTGATNAKILFTVAAQGGKKLSLLDTGLLTIYLKIVTTGQ
tara:strand:- start:22067 stop:22570 length:504 start_codon:yes stop_codon:yes gene_type:complete